MVCATASSSGRTSSGTKPYVVTACCGRLLMRSRECAMLARDDAHTARSSRMTTAVTTGMSKSLVKECRSCRPATSWCAGSTTSRHWTGLQRKLSECCHGAFGTPYLRVRE
jgi:hypothetical protein